MSFLDPSLSPVDMRLTVAAVDLDLSFTTGGGANWFRQTTVYYHDGDAAMSGSIWDGQESWMQTTVDVESGHTETLTFYWKVSSEGDSDYLKFYIDGVLKDQISGEVGWQQKSYNISSAGSHTLKWRYVKDDNESSSGWDCGWVDYVQWTASPEPPGPPQQPPVPPAQWTTAVYTYDPSGRRIAKSIDNDYTVKYCYDGDHVIAEYDGEGTLLRKYVYGPRVDEPVCMINVADDNEVSYYHFDGLGSVIALSDPNGDTVQTYEYSVYGEVAASDVNHPNPIMFTGRWFDQETGLYYYRARYYHPSIGRFLQTDPVGYGMNLYAYCNNNPLNSVDPSGCEPNDSNDTNDVNDVCSHSDDPIDYSHLTVWDWIREGVKAFGEGLLDGAELTSYGISFCFLGDKARMAELEKRYPWASQVSEFCGGTTTVCGALVGAMQFFALDISLSTGLAAGETAVFYRGANPLVNIKYSADVLKQMSDPLDTYHSFPRLVDTLAKTTDASTITGGDGITRTLVKIPGAINGKEGHYTYIIDTTGEITHRLFEETKVPK